MKLEWQIALAAFVCASVAAALATFAAISDKDKANAEYSAWVKMGGNHNELTQEEYFAAKRFTPYGQQVPPGIPKYIQGKHEMMEFGNTNATELVSP